MEEIGQAAMKQLIAGDRKTVTLETVVQALELDKKFGFVTCTTAGNLG